MQAETARQKLRAGLLAEGDVLQLEVARDLAQASLVTARGDVDRSRDALAEVLGLDHDVPFAVDRAVPPPPELDVDAEAVLARALERRTEILDARIDLQSARLDLDVTRAAGGIDASIVASTGLQGDGTTMRDAIDARVPDRSVGASLSLPIWDGGRRRRLVDEARARRVTSQLSAEESRRGVINAVPERLRALEESRGRAEVLERAVDAARRSYEIAGARFEAGTIDSQRLVQEQDAHARAESDHLNAVIDVHLAIASLRRSILGPIPRRGKAGG